MESSRIRNHFISNKNDYQGRRAKTASNANRDRSSRGKQPRQVSHDKPAVIYTDDLKDSKRITDSVNNDPDALMLMLKRLEGNATKEKEQSNREKYSGVPKFQNQFLQKHSKSSYQFEFIDKRSNFVDEHYSTIINPKQKPIENSKLLKHVQRQSSSLSKALKKIIRNKMPNSCKNKNMINHAYMINSQTNRNNNDLGIVKFDNFEINKPHNSRSSIDFRTSKSSAAERSYQIIENNTDQAIVITKNLDNSSREEFRRAHLKRKYNVLQRKTPLFVSQDDILNKIKIIRDAKAHLENRQLNSSQNDIDRNQNSTQSKTRDHKRMHVLTKLAISDPNDNKNNLIMRDENK